MQCQSYFPVYYSHYDPNVDPNGKFKPMFSGNTTFKNGHYNNNLMIAPASQSHFGYEKEILRQTILKHETTFRDQVLELHRLYRRQKELMDEINKKELQKSHSHLDSQWSNSFSSKVSSSNVQNALLSVPLVLAPSSIGADCTKTPLSSIKGNSTPASFFIPQNVCSPNDYHPQLPTVKTFGGKALDLELPADEYINSEEAESLQEIKSFEAPKIVRAASDRKTELCFQADANPFSAWWPSYQGVVASPVSLTNRSIHFDAQNKGNGVRLGVSNHWNSGLGPNSHVLTLDCHASQIGKATSEMGSHPSLRKPVTNVSQIPVGDQGLPSFTHHFSSNKVSNTSVESFGHVEGSFQFSSISSFGESRRLSSCSESSLKETTFCSTSVASGNLIRNGQPYLGCIDSNSAKVGMATNGKINRIGEDLPQLRSNFDVEPMKDEPGSDSSKGFCFLDTSNCVDSEEKQSKRFKLLDINMPCDPTTDGEKPLSEDDKKPDMINSNSSTNDDRVQAKLSSLRSSAIEIDLEAPASPETEEHPRPREDSEENQTEDEDSQEKLSKLAAEAIVSLSLSKRQPFYCEDENSKQSEAPGIELLHLLAGFVCTMADQLENDSAEIWSRNSAKCGNFPSPLSDGIDCFEAMTLNQPEMKVEEYRYKNNVAEDEETCGISRPHQQRKGRTKRAKKDFQREVLPSLASLSRYEVTEDILMMEGLMEAAGAPWQSSRARKAGRNRKRLRGRKQLNLSSDSLMEVKDKGLVSWGTVNKRPRAQRCRASPSTLLSRWLQYEL